MKLKEYKVYGDDKTYTDITFADDKLNEVTFSRTDNSQWVIDDVDGTITIDQLQYCINKLKEGKIEVGLYGKE